MKFETNLNFLRVTNAQVFYDEFFRFNSTRVAYIVYEEWNSNSSATETQKMTLEIAEEKFKLVLESLKTLINKELKEIGDALDKVNAPYTPNRSLID